MSAFDSVRFNSGRPLLAEITSDKLNAILAEIRKNRPRGERGITVRESGDATYIGLASQRTVSGFQEQTHAFKINVSSPDANQYEATVSPGTINSLLPSNCFDGAELRKFSVTANQLVYINLNCTSDGQKITSATIAAEATAPLPQPPTLFSLPTAPTFLIGVVYNSSVYQAVTDNITVSGKQAFIKNATGNVQPGQLGYEIWYNWG
jgi:hypothetical protein